MSTEEEQRVKQTLDLSNKQLKKVPKQEDAQNVRKLILDENELQKIDNIDSYLKIELLSLSKNQLLRMYGVCRLHCLRELNLSFNQILSIEGLKDCVHLRHLNLEGNNIKTIEHLNTNINLEYLNLAENSIGNISDMSYLRNLKELYLHGNRLTHLRQCDKYLPASLEQLTLAKNSIADLNEICTLSHLCNLQGFSIAENPCVTMTVGPNCLDGFDHRPFVLNWCMTVTVIDGYVVDPIESLKAEWLYSQGRGRQFRVGEQAALAKYLSSVCPLVGKALENENERKLRLILSKAQHHQRQLQEEIMDNANSSASNSPSSNRKKPTSRIQSPRFSRLSGRQGSPESMISSYHGNTSSDHAANNSNHSSLQMTTSLIENIKNDSILSQSSDSFSLASSGMSSSITTKTYNSQESTPRNITPNPYNDQSFLNQTQSGGPLSAASKMVPVPETLMSPDVCPAAVAQRVAVSALNSQIQNTTKIVKNKGSLGLRRSSLNDKSSPSHSFKDNKLSSPRVRSPHLRRTNSPTTSPRKSSNSNVPQSNQSNRQQRPGPTAAPTQAQQATESSGINAEPMRSRSGFVTNSVLVMANDGDSAGFSSDDDSEQFNMDKLKTIRNKAAQRTQQQQQHHHHHQNNRRYTQTQSEQDTESSAVVIQKIWRGYRTRKKTKDIAEKLQKQRTHEYIDKLTKDMELTKAQLENERKIQQLQMQAINALWKKVSTMQQNDSNGTQKEQQTSEQNVHDDSAAVVQDLAKNCSLLTNQVQQLQSSMGNIVNCLTMVCNLPQDAIKKLINTSGNIEEQLQAIAASQAQMERDSAATQTEIVAVHTPQMEGQGNFPFTRMRPSTLPLGETQVASNALPSVVQEEQCEEEETVGEIEQEQLEDFSDESGYKVEQETTDEKEEDETECFQEQQQQ